MDLLKIRMSVMGGGRFLTLRSFQADLRGKTLGNSHIKTWRINHCCANPKADWGGERGESIKLS